MTGKSSDQGVKVGGMEKGKELSKKLIATFWIAPFMLLYYLAFLTLKGTL